MQANQSPFILRHASLAKRHKGNWAADLACRLSPPCVSRRQSLIVSWSANKGSWFKVREAEETTVPLHLLCIALHLVIAFAPRLRSSLFTTAAAYSAASSRRQERQPAPRANTPTQRLRPHPISLSRAQVASRRIASQSSLKFSYTFSSRKNHFLNTSPACEAFTCFPTSAPLFPFLETRVQPVSMEPRAS